MAIQPNLAMSCLAPIPQPVGSAVTLMLRPEELRLGEGSGANQLTGEVKSVSFQGSVVRVRLQPAFSNNGFGSLTLDIFNERALQLPQVGQTHTLSFPAHACWVMPADEKHHA